MAKALLTTSPVKIGAPKKVHACKAEATRCTLLDLCPEDKAKVAKLIHQVVDLGKELSQCKAKLASSQSQRCCKHGSGALQAAQDLQERTQHLRQRHAAVSQENHMLKAKLTHAFTLLRTYQHKVQALESASGPAAALQNASSATATAELHHQADMQGDLHPRSDLVLDRPGSASSDTAVAHGSHSGTVHQHTTDTYTSAPAPVAKPNKHNRRQHGALQHTKASVKQHVQHEASHQCTQPLQSEVRQSTAQHSTLGGAFADLAAQTLALQHSDVAEGALSSPADPNDGKVLRFDPALGPDGGFYFVSWDNSQSPQHRPHVKAPAEDVNQVDHGHQVQWEQHSQWTAVDSGCEEQHTTLDSSDSSAQQVLQIDTSALSDSTHEAASAVGQTTAMPTQSNAAPTPTDAVKLGLLAVPAESNSQSGALSAAQASSTAAHAGPASAVPAPVAALSASFPFPVQGGGEAGMLLRAAAAAASGCSHQLVLAAAGRCETETTRSNMECQKHPQEAHDSQQDSRAVMQQGAQPPTAVIGGAPPSTHALVASQAQVPQHSGHAPPVMVTPAVSQKQQQPVPHSAQHVVAQHKMQQQQQLSPGPLLASSQQPAASSEPAPCTVTASVAHISQSPPNAEAASPDTVGNTGEDELGFDSSLMDLVAEVEQMVACNLHTSQIAVHSSKSHVSTPVSRSQNLACHQQASTQQPAWLVAASGIQVGGYDGLFEENDVVSMISDQEYGAYQQY